MPFVKGQRQDCQYKKGYTPWNKGLSPSLEVRAKISKALKGIKREPNRTSFKKGHPGIRGVDNNKWKGGVTPLKKAIRGIVNYKDWIKAVFKRDNYTCQMCETRGGALHADHYPKSFIKILEENSINNLEEALDCDALWNVDNGRTLCKGCHYLVTYGRRMPREDLPFGTNLKHLN